jgi:hypothetical protein
MKLEDKWIIDRVDNKMVHKRTFDLEPSLKVVKDLKDGGHTESLRMSDSYLAARIPLWVINDILKKAGVKWDDPASKEVIMAALNSPDYAKFRVWEGKI